LSDYSFYEISDSKSFCCLNSLDSSLGCCSGV